MTEDLYKRPRVVMVGGLALGGQHPVRIQSMTNTNTMDTASTVAQVIRLVKAGCEMVRITAPGLREAENLANIKKQLLVKGINIPLIADIHFNPKAAEVAAQFVEKIRINPGNYTDRKKGKPAYSETAYRLELEKIALRLKPLLSICKEKGTAIRIGTNHGSLSERILARYGNTPKGMVESAMEFVRICREADFHQLVLSMKASNVKQMMEANQLLVERMIAEDSYYPVHLGVTEAGDGEDGRIKSAAGIGSLLAMGIGDTIRVSLTEEPEAEIPVARKLLFFYGQKDQIPPQIHAEKWYLKPEVSSEIGFPAVVTGTPSEKADLFAGNQLTKAPSGRLIHKLIYPSISVEDLCLKAAVDYKRLYDAEAGGIWIDNGEGSDPETLASLSFNILQGLGLRISKTEFIACPSCGRTLFNIMEQLEKVRHHTSHLKGLKIAVMGCIVNGPGEMADADYGYVGAGPAKVSIYKGQHAILKNIGEEAAVDALIQLIKEGGDWQDASRHDKDVG